MDAMGLERAAAIGGGDLLEGRVSRVQRGAEGEPEVVARELESLFATLLVTEMRKSMKDGFFGSGPGADTFNGWFDEELGASVASRGSLGIAETVTESLVRQREAEAAEKARKEAAK